MSATGIGASVRRKEDQRPRKQRKGMPPFAAGLLTLGFHAPHWGDVLMVALAGACGGKPVTAPLPPGAPRFAELANAIGFALDALRGHVRSELEGAPRKTQGRRHAWAAECRLR